MRTLDMTVIGDLFADILTSPVSSYPKEDSQNLVEMIEMEVGGGAAHFALAASRLGLRTRMIGMIGNDVFGNFILNDMEMFGIDSKIKRCEKVGTGVSMGIQFNNGSRSLLTYRGANELFSKGDFDLKDIGGR